MTTILKPKNNYGPKIRITALSNAKLMGCFVESCSVYDACIDSGLGYGTVREYVNALVKEGLLFRAGRAHRRDLWQWGPGEKDRFRRISPIDRQRTLREARRIREQMSLLGQATNPL